MEKRTVEPKTIAGFMELLPEEQILFNQMVDTIRKSYESFGFLPLDTPIIEYSEVLLAKAGGETEKQIYRFEKGETDLQLSSFIRIAEALGIVLRLDVNLA